MALKLSPRLKMRCQSADENHRPIGSPKLESRTSPRMRHDSTDRDGWRRGTESPFAPTIDNGSCQGLRNGPARVVARGRLRAIPPQDSIHHIKLRKTQHEKSSKVFPRPYPRYLHFVRDLPHTVWGLVPVARRRRPTGDATRRRAPGRAMSTDQLDYERKVKAAW